MVLPRGSGDFYHKYRPQRFEELTGHKDLAKSLKNSLLVSEPSQSFLLYGDSGTGKTTSARIMALLVNCLSRTPNQEPCLECPSCRVILSGNCVDIVELNAADNRGIDAMRNISSTLSLSSMQVSNKVVILDEVHMLTKEAQSSILKVLEESPKDTFIILCTTNPEKLLPTVKNRCQIFRFKLLPRSEIVGLLSDVCTYEALELSAAVLNKIADSSQGSPRNALVKLQQVSQLGSTNEGAISLFLEAEDVDGNIVELFSSFARDIPWPKVVACYQAVQDMGPPAIGMSLAGYFRNKLIASKSAELSDVYSKLLDLFVRPLDDGKVGENQLVSLLFKAHKMSMSLPSITSGYKRNINGTK